MAAVDYVDPEGYWMDPDGNVHRMGHEDGEQEIIATVTPMCSHAERILLTRALDRAARNNEKPPIAACPKCRQPLPGVSNFDSIYSLRCQHCDALFEQGEFVCFGRKPGVN
jgi:hypothetical protein